MDDARERWRAEHRRRRIRNRRLAPWLRAGSPDGYVSDGGGDGGGDAG